MSVSTERITVMGIGNPLVKDEGVGVRVVEALMSGFEFPDNITLLDAGTMGMGILNLLKDCDYLLVLDAVDGTGRPAGTVVRLSPEDLAPTQVLHSLHDMRLIDVLQAATLVGTRPEAECVGVQILDMDGVAIGLTEPVEAALPTAVAAALQVLAERGVTAKPRTDAPVDARILEAIRTWDAMPGAERG